MGGWQERVIHVRQQRAQRAQQMARIYTVMACLVSLIFLQFLLLSVALEGYLGGRAEITVPTALASGLCFAGACWLIRYVRPWGRR